MQWGQSGLKAGDVLGGRYRIRALSGSGGSGAVYEADDLKLAGKRWAVKEVRSEPHAGNPLIREAEMLTKLNHPCLPRIVDYFPPALGGYGYLVTDFIDGQTLAEKYAGIRRIRVEEMVRIAIELCRCFDYLHGLAEPIVYRDLKPSNVMLDERGNVYLIDFGIARHDRGDLDTLPLGTAAFAAPEQREGRRTDARTDLYGLGALMYFLLSGGKYVDDERVPLTRLCSDVPESLATIVDKLLRRRPQDRVQTAAELEQLLLAVEAERLPPSSARGRTLNDRMMSDRMLHERMLSERPIGEQTPRERSKIVVIGSLFPGAGASYVTVALARVLSRIGILHAVAEYPGISPELYHLLDGERRCPARYTFVRERLNSESEEMLTSSSVWKDGKTTWYPLHPDRDGEKFEQDGDVFRWLEALPDPLVIVDISHGWQLPGASELSERADVLLWVADAHPGKFNGYEARRQAVHAAEWRRLGREAHFVANRIVTSRGGMDWIEALPWAPLCALPLADEIELYEGYRKGRLAQDRPRLLARNQKAFQPLLHLLFSDYAPELKKPLFRKTKIGELR